MRDSGETTGAGRAVLGHDNFVFVTSSEDNERTKMKRGIKRLPCGNYLAWYGTEEVTYDTKGAAESWVTRQRVQNELDNGLEDREYYMSISEIADVIGISKQRVRQLEQRALLKIKKALAEFV